MKIPFNNPSIVGDEISCLEDAVAQKHLSGDGKYTKLCQQWLNENAPTKKTLLTHSCTAALEMSALLCGIEKGDEVIMPSFTFVSTANAFVLRGAKIVFVDICPETQNIDASLVEQAVTDKTKAIVPVHYAGVACEMDTITAIARKYRLYVVEDAAQAIMSTYKSIPLGTLGDIGAYSFHETKNIHCGEGGVVFINNKMFMEQAEIIREKGTDRSKFFRGEVDKYSWVDKGSSYLPSELNAAYLYAQLKCASKVNEDRLKSWERYYEGLKNINNIKLPVIPGEAQHNGHIFYIKTESLQVRDDFINYMKHGGVNAVFHYVPLHSSPAGLKHSRVSGNMKVTNDTSDTLVRLPLYYKITNDQIDRVIGLIHDYRF